MTPEAFLLTRKLFTRQELATALRDRGSADSTLDAHLTRWTKKKRIARVKQGLFVRLDGGLPDFIVLASRMAPDAAVSYHTALEAHGAAQSVFERLYFVTWTRTKPLAYKGRRFIPVRPRSPLDAAGGGERWIERAERGGNEFRVTTIERTVVDVLDRPALAGGIEEVWRSLHSVPALDPGALEAYVRLLGPSVSAKVGFFLESRREELAIPEALLKRLRSRVPGSPVFMDRRRKGRLVSGWSLIVPAELLPDGVGVRL
jgi:predicted transcriptional regulator of viral defense system